MRISDWSSDVCSSDLTLSALVTASQGAVGSLQAQQATNQLLALSTKQQLQIQNLMAAQYRSEALDQARKAQAEEAARAATARFLGSGPAYPTPSRLGVRKNHDMGHPTDLARCLEDLDRK